MFIEVRDQFTGDIEFTGEVSMVEFPRIKSGMRAFIFIAFSPTSCIDLPASRYSITVRPDAESFKAAVSTAPAPGLQRTG